MKITLTKILEKGQKLLQQVQTLGFVNLRIVNTPKELYFIVDRDPNIDGSSINNDFLLEATFKSILSCNLQVRMQNTTEEPFWITLQENSASIIDIKSILQKFGKLSVDEIMFDVKELSVSDIEQLQEISGRIEEERRHLKRKTVESDLSEFSIFTHKHHKPDETTPSSIDIGLLDKLQIAACLCCIQHNYPYVA